MTQSLPPKSLVLYADDDADDIQLVSLALRDYAHSIELISFNNGVELLDFTEKLQLFQPAPCLIILDINMPRLNGKETLVRLRKNVHLKDVPVVLFSTSTLPSEIAFAKNFGAGFITKPLDSTQMKQVIDQLIDHCAEETKKIFRKKGDR